MSKDILEEAKKRVKEKKDFFGHLAAFVSVGIFFFLMNMVTMGNEPKIWFFFPMLPWGIGLMIHYFTVFGFPGSGVLSKEWESKEMEKEVNRLRRERGLDNLPPTTTQEDNLDLRELSPEEQREWDQKDFV